MYNTSTMNRLDVLRSLSLHVHDTVYSRYFFGRRSVFLCGADVKDRSSVRFRIAQELEYDFFFGTIYYPEDLFDDLLHGDDRYDLISLEDVLANSVDLIVLVVESAGAIAELGAFVSNDRLRRKLICVLDKRHERDRSFIRNGPIRLMRDKKEGGIIYHDFGDLSGIVARIRRMTGRHLNFGFRDLDITNVLQAHLFVFACLYIVDYLTRDEIREMVAVAAKCDLSQAGVLVAAAISMLSARGEIALSPDGYKLTRMAIRRIDARGRVYVEGQHYSARDFDRVRIEYLNWHHKRKIPSFGGGAV